MDIAVNGTIEIAGPDAFHIDEVVGKVLEYDKDPRKVVVDPEALYFGVKLSDQSLIPGPARPSSNGGSPTSRRLRKSNRLIRNHNLRDLREGEAP